LTTALKSAVVELLHTEFIEILFFYYALQFLMKYSYYRETLGIFQQKPTGHDENLVSIVTFMAQV